MLDAADFDVLAALTWTALVPIGLVVWFSWEYRRRPAFRWLIVAMGAAALWTVARGFALLFESAALTRLFDRVLLFAISLVAICWFLMAVESVFHRPVSDYAFAGLLSVPVATQFIGLAQPRLLYTDDSYVDSRGVFYNELGPWLQFDLHVFGYGLTLAAMGLWVARALTGRRQQRESSAIMLAGTVLLVAPSLLHNFGLVPEYADLTPAALFVTGGLLFYALRERSTHALEPGPGRDRAFDIIDDAVLLLDDRGIVVDANARFRELVDAEQVIGHPGTDVLADAAGLTEAIADGTRQWSGVISFADRQLDATLSSVAYGTGARSVIIALTDITENKTRERELRRQNERLEKFTSIVSHDLRNPLQVAMGRADILAEQVDNSHVPALRRALDRIDTLVSETLTLAREGRTVSDTEPVALDAACQRSWDRVKTPAARLRIVDEGTVRADKSRVEQIFENLFRNAVKHGGDRVTVTVGRTDDGFYIDDDGPGIPPGEREDVVEFGYSSESDGTGYGLHIVSEVAAAHGWAVDIGESPGGGARFVFSGVSFVSQAAASDGAP